MKKTNRCIKPPDGSRMRLKRKQIQCPRCGSRIIDASMGTKTLIRVLPEKEELPADYYMKCKHCRTEIGLKKLE